MQATVKYPLLAAVIAEIEKTGLTKAAIGRLAGRDGSAATRWAKGTHQPAWAAAKALADAVRSAGHARLADDLLAAWHYYNDPVEPAPGSTVPADVLAVIRKRYPGRQAEIIGMLEELSERDEAAGERSPGEGRSPGPRDASGTSRAG